MRETRGSPARIWPAPDAGRLAGHILGERGTVRHMCPSADCRQHNGQPNPFCAVCLGAGDISTDRLDRWQREVWRGVQT